MPRILFSTTGRFECDVIVTIYLIPSETKNFIVLHVCHRICEKLFVESSNEETMGFDKTLIVRRIYLITGTDECR